VIRAFFIECSGAHWLNIAHTLLGDHGVAPVLWSGDATTVRQAKREFAGALAVIGVDAACGRVLHDLGWIPKPLDAPTLQALANDESIALSMMDRMDQDRGSFDHEARRRHWHDLLQTWGAALDMLQPDVVIFSMSPHIVYDYALYALCKHRGIETRMFERAMLPGLVFVISCFEDGSPQLRAALEASQGPELPTLNAALQQHLDDIRGGGETALPANYRKKLAARGVLKKAGRQADAGVLRMLAYETKRVAYLYLRTGGPPRNYFVRQDANGRLVSPTLWQWLVARWKGQFLKRRLRRVFDGLARPIDRAQPYVLLALHYQPERAIVPMAGEFGDQLLIVDILARTLPPGWQLVVREHPWQLTPFGRGELGRTEGFYRRIAEYGNVVLAPIDSDGEALRDGARAVATATGSIGWQAIVRGMPALVFGAAWYADSPGAYRIHDVRSCRDAMKAIGTGKGVPAFAAERMMAALKAVSVQGYLEPDLEDVAGLAEDQAVAAMAEALFASMANVEGAKCGSSPTVTASSL